MHINHLIQKFYDRNKKGPITYRPKGDDSTKFLPQSMDYSNMSEIDAKSPVQSVYISHNRSVSLFQCEKAMKFPQFKIYVK